MLLIYFFIAVLAIMNVDDGKNALVKSAVVLSILIILCVIVFITKVSIMSISFLFTIIIQLLCR
jgi:hypothetical protein